MTIEEKFESIGYKKTELVNSLCYCKTIDLSKEKGNRARFLKNAKGLRRYIIFDKTEKDIEFVTFLFDKKGSFYKTEGFYNKDYEIYLFIQEQIKELGWEK